MPTPLIIALGVVAWIVVAVPLGIFVGRALRLGKETDAEVAREFAKGGEEW